MKYITTAILLALVMISCNTTSSGDTAKTPDRIIGTWKLLKGTLIGQNDTTVTDYTKNTSFIKIINGTHFAFLQHDLNKGKDSASFSAGGGRYTIRDSVYTEHLEYCNAREWEGNDFSFTVSINNDTLVQKGMEKVPGTNIERLNIEQYVKVK